MTDVLQVDQGEEHPKPQSLRGLSLVSAFLLGGMAFMDFVLFVGLATRLILVRSLMEHVSVDRSLLVASDAFIRLTSLAMLPLSLACVVVFCVWIYRAYKNLKAFRLGALEHSPGMAPGSFFIPVANLVLPYLIMKEIWRGSDPSYPPLDADPFEEARTTAMLLPWWLLFLTRGLAGWTSIVVSFSERSLAALNVSTIALLVSCTASLVSALLALFLVLGTGRRQAALSSALLTREAIPA